MTGNDVTAEGWPRDGEFCAPVDGFQTRSGKWMWQSVVGKHEDKQMSRSEASATTLSKLTGLGVGIENELEVVQWADDAGGQPRRSKW